MTGTQFERQRGVSQIEVKRGYAQAIVQGLPDPVEPNRLEVLRVAARVGVSVAFVKFLASGIAFLVADLDRETLRQALEEAGYGCVIQGNKVEILVHAVNIRDGQGLLASVIQAGIESGVSIDHIGDMHDKVLLVVSEDHEPRLLDRLQKEFKEAKIAR